MDPDTDLTATVHSKIGDDNFALIGRGKVYSGVNHGNDFAVYI